MKIEKQEDHMTSHAVLVHEGAKYHRREKSRYDRSAKKWVRQSLVWEKDQVCYFPFTHRTLAQEEVSGLSAKQLEREYQLARIL